MARTNTLLRSLLAMVLALLFLPVSAGAVTLDAQSGVWSPTMWQYGACTRIGDTSFSVADTAANVAIYRPGVPMRYGDAIGTWRYGVISTVADAGATLTVTLGGGAAMTAAFDGHCQHGNPLLLTGGGNTDGTIPGWYSDANDAAALLHDLLWVVPPSRSVTRYLMYFCAMPLTDDTGANEPTAQILINGVAATTALTMTQAGYTCTSPATIDAAQYDMLYGEAWEFSVVKGSNGDSNNWSWQVVWLVVGE
jgi:hypothetical protein